MGKNRKVSITISIPAFNRLELLKRTLASVFAQTEKPDEIIVVDDCSTDGTWEYLKKIEGIKAYRNKKNLGMIENWNETIRRAKSDYVVSLHSDDIILPDYIKGWKEKITKAIEKEPLIAAFFSAGYNIDEEDSVTGIVKPFPKDLLLTPPDTLKFFWDNFCFYISVTGWTVYKKEIVEKVGYFTRKYNIASENDMSMKILPNYPVYYSSEPLFAFRRHGLQGFEGKTSQFSIAQEIKNITDAFRVLRDYENRPEIQKSFTKKERAQRIFVCKPIVFLVPYSIYKLVLFDFESASKYLQVFLKNYPKPVFTLLTLKFVIQCFSTMLKQFIDNIMISLKAREKSVLTISVK